MCDGNCKCCTSDSLEKIRLMKEQLENNKEVFAKTVEEWRNQIKIRNKLIKQLKLMTNYQDVIINIFYDDMAEEVMAGIYLVDGMINYRQMDDLEPNTIVKYEELNRVLLELLEKGEFQNGCSERPSVTVFNLNTLGNPLLD